MKKFLALLLALALTIPTAFAWGWDWEWEEPVSPYPDLPYGHWAFYDMDRAVEQGIVTGYPDGTMRPDETITWGQFLVMVCRTVYGKEYAAALAEGQAWDYGAVAVAFEKELVTAEEFAAQAGDDPAAPILRQDAALLLHRVVAALEEEGNAGNNVYRLPLDKAEEDLSDYGDMAEHYQAAVSNLYSYRVVRGNDTGAFSGEDTIKRSDGVTLLMRSVDVLENCRRGTETTVILTAYNPDGSYFQDMEPITVTAKVGDYVDELMETYYGPYMWMTLCEDRDLLGTVSSLKSEYTFTFRPYSTLEVAFAAKLAELPEEERYWMEVADLRAIDDNYSKRLALFGNTDVDRFSGRSEAEANMTTVAVPVWKLDRNGNKVSGQSYVTVHSALAEDIVSIFTEIYNDPEQFPFKDVGGYSWRGDSSRSEHCSGTALDLNYNENYQIRNGNIETGSLWAPGENPYSIPVDGSVVRIFAKYGWAWGGDEWAGHADPTEGYHDYMHFSYLGG